MNKFNIGDKVLIPRGSSSENLLRAAVVIEVIKNQNGNLIGYVVEGEWCKNNWFVFADKEHLIKMNLLDALVCDLDGTLCNEDHRRPITTGTGWGEKEYNEYYAEMHKDTPYRHIQEIIKRFSEDHEIIFVTGRPDKYIEATTNWLNTHLPDIKYKLIMRKDGNYDCDTVVKTKIYNELIKPNYNVMFVLEDRTRVVKMWRDLGVPCLQVQQSDF